MVIGLLCAASPVGAAPPGPRPPQGKQPPAAPRPVGGGSSRPGPTRPRQEEEEKEEGDALRERSDWFAKQRSFPFRDVPRGARGRAFAQSRRVSAAAPGGGAAAPLSPRRGGSAPLIGGLDAAAVPAAFEWSSLGPEPISLAGSASAPFSGRVSAIAPHPTDANTVYVGGAAGGVWKTADGGQTWGAVFDQQPSLTLGALAVSPADGNLVLAGTGEANYSSSSYYGAGIFRSTTGGNTWSKATASPSIDGCSIADLAFRPGAPQVAFAAVVRQPGSVGPSGCPNPGVYRSADGGATWAQVIQGANASDLAVDSEDATRWYVAFWGVGIYRFNDAGALGAKLTNGLPASGFGRVAIAVAPTNANRVYAAFATSQGGLMGIYTSASRGDGWSGPVSPSAHGYYMFPWYALTLQVNRTDPGVLYAGSGPYLLRYSGAGATYDFPAYQQMHADFHALAYDAAGRLWIGNDGGVYRTTDFTSVVNRNTNLSITQFEPGIGVSAGGVLSGGTQDNGTLRYGGVRSWPQLLGCDGGWSVIHPTDPQRIVMTPQGDGSCLGHRIFRTTDGGASVLAADSGVTGTEAGLFYSPLVSSPASPDRLYYGRTHLWTSANFAQSWSALPGTFGSSISAIGASSSTSVLYVGTETGKLWSTQNGGAQWTERSGLPTRYVTDILVDPTSSGTAYVTFSGFGTGHLFKTTNFGADWEDLSDTLGVDTPGNAIAADFRTTPATLFLATDVGTFASSDSGASWQDATPGMPRTIALDVAVDAAGDQLIVATHGRGMWSAPLAATPDAQGTIAFSSTRDGDGEIFTMDAGGGAVDQLTSNTAADFHPSWSPDGSRIAFESNRDGDYEIWTMAADGTDPVQLTSNASLDAEPAFSPDGATVAFESNRDGNFEIYRVPATGGTAQRLTNDAANDYEPAWSPDGTSLAFHRGDAAAGELWRMQADGDGPTRLTTNSVLDEYPDFSPSGAKIAYDGNTYIRTIDADGSNLAQLTNDPTANDIDPDWSTDGDMLAFASDRDGALGDPKDVYLMRSDGSQIRNLTANAAADESPVWKPDATPPRANLAVAKVDAEDPVTVGGTVTWTITASNAGPDPAASVVVTDEVPAAASLKSASPSQGGCAGTTTVTCQLGALAAGEQATVTLTASATTAGTLTNRATASAGTADPVAADNQDTETTTVQAGATLPQTTIVSGPPRITNERGATFDLASDPEPATFECRLDGAAFEDCSSPAAVGDLEDGEHTLDARAVTSAGADPSPARWEWTVDTAAPQTAIDAAPPASTSLTTASFSFSASETGALFSCALDQAAASDCTSPREYQGLAVGEHTFTVTARDAAGNADPTPATRTWTVTSSDPTAPDTQIDSGPAGTVQDYDASFSFSSPSAGATFECRMDAGSYQACVSPVTYLNLLDGAHTLRVRAISGGTPDPTPATRAWTIDTQPPQTTLNAGPSGLVGTRNASFAFSASEAGSTFECRLDGGGFGACGSPRAYAGLADGAHRFQARARDAAGNLDPTPVDREWTIDATPPETTIADGPPALTRNPFAAFAFSANEPGASFRCATDAGARAGCRSPFSLTVGDGAHHFSVQAVDAAGGVDATPAARDWTLDTVPPDTSILSGPPEETSATTATLAVAGTEPGARFECRLDGAAFAACGAANGYGGLAQGRHTFDARATDPAGNTDASPASRSWRITSGRGGALNGVVSGGRTFSARALRRGTRLRFACAVACSLRLELRADRATVRRLRLRGRVIARGRARLANAGSGRARLRSTASARGPLRRLRRGRGTLTATFSAPGVTSELVRLPVRLRR